MRMSLIVLALLGLCAVRPAAQTASCAAGTPDHFLVWNSANDATNGGVVYGPIVPQSEAWLVDGAGLFTNDQYPTGSEWMMEVIEPIPEQTGLVDSADPNRCCWRIPVAKQLGALATPLLALSRPLVLRPGQRLAGRTNASGHAFGIDGTFWRFSANCAATLAAR